MRITNLTTAVDRRRVLAGGLAAVLIGATGLLGMSPVAQAFELNGKPKIAFIYPDVSMDGGWDESMESARKVIEADQGVEITVIQSIPEETAKVKKAADDLVAQGFNIIISHSYGYSAGMLQAANAHPTVAFMNTSGATNSANLESFYVRTYQGWYLAGMAAAATSKSGKIGIVGGFPIGVVNWDVNAFALGAQAINPDVETHIEFIKSWYDPDKEGAVSEAMLDLGVDVLGNDLSSTALFTAAEKRGAKSIGFQLDTSKHAPNGNLTSVMFNWENHLVPTIRAITDGTWIPNDWGAFPGLTEGVLAMAPLSDDIPADAKAKIKAAQAAMIAGTFTPFDGPIYAQDGSTVVKPGVTLDDGGLWGMEFLVKGTVGTLN